MLRSKSSRSFGIAAGGAAPRRADRCRRGRRSPRRTAAAASARAADAPAPPRQRGWGHARPPGGARKVAPGRARGARRMLCGCACARCRSRARGAPLELEQRAGARARSGRGAAARERVRRLPHRSAPARRRAARSRAGRSRRDTRSSAASIASARACASSRSVTASACRGSAGPAALPLLRQRARESLRRGGVHRLPARRRLRRVRGGRRALLLPAARTRSTTSLRRRSCARALIGYRCLRLAGDAETLGPLRLRRGGPRRDPGGAPPGPARVRVHAPAAIADAQRFALELGAEWAGASDAAPPEPLDAAILFAPVGRARARRAARGGQGRRP